MQIIKSITHESKDFDEDIKKFQNETMTYSITQGMHNAQQNKPTTIEEFNAYIFNYITIKTEEWVQKNMQQFLPISGMVVANKIQKEADQKCMELTGQLNECEHKLVLVEQKKKELTPDLKQIRKRKISNIVVGLIGIAEGYLIYEALRKSGFHTMAAIITSICLAAGIAYVTNIAAEFIKRAISKRQLIKRSCFVLSIALVFFLILGTIRAQAYNATANLKEQASGIITPNAGNNSGGKIAMVSFFLYAIGLAIAVRYARTKEEKDQEKVYDKICGEYDELKANIYEYTNAIDTIKRQTAEHVHSALATYEYAKARERQLYSIANKALEAYANNNLRHRTDAVCPAFFSSLPPFQFTTFFDNRQPKND